MGSRTGRSTWVRRVKPLALVPILTLIALICWGFSSAPGSSPDDDFHLASIWCAAGTSASACEPASQAGKREVPEDLVVTDKCFVGKPQVSAGCQGKNFGTRPDPLVVTDRGNFNSHLYPPLFYLAMSPFVGNNVSVSIAAMRIANSVLFVALVTALFLLLPIRRRSTLVWSISATVVPLGFFLIPSTNPSGWAILSASTLWIALLGFFETTGKRRVGLAIAATLATIIGAGARADAAVYAVLAIGAVAILKFRPTKRFFLQCIFAAALAVIAVGFYLTSSQGSSAVEGIQSTSGWGDFAFVTKVFLDTPSLWVGVFGYWPLGWIDTVLPAIVWVASFGVYAAAIFIGLGRRVSRKSLVVGLLFIAMWIVPAYTLIQSSQPVGNFVQPRYLLPPIILVVGFALLKNDTASLFPLPAQRLPVIGALTIANLVALHTNIRRYVTGTDAAGWNLDSGAKWWWHIVTSPNVVWLVGSVAFCAALLLLAFCSRKTLSQKKADSAHTKPSALRP